ncbi:hypothetical protein [Thalassiella azotivora]
MSNPTGSEIADDRESTPTLSTLANPRRVRWTSLQQSDRQE